jgi:hypothetical protein
MVLFDWTEPFRFRITEMRAFYGSAFRLQDLFGSVLSGNKPFIIQHFLAEPLKISVYCTESFMVARLFDRTKNGSANAAEPKIVQ